MTETLHFELDPEEKDVFCLESEELIGRLDADLLAIEQDQCTPEVVQDLFRAAHTLKSSAGAIGHQRMANLTHAMETVLELLRQSRLTVTPELTDLLLQAVDALRSLNEEVTTCQHGGVDPAGLIRRLLAIAADNTANQPQAALAGLPGGQQQVEAGLTGLGAEQEPVLRITARIAADSIAPAARVLQIFLALEEGGRIPWSAPDREAVEQGQPMHEATLLFEGKWSDGEVREHLKHISEIDWLDVTRASGTPEVEAETGELEAGKNTSAVSTRSNGNSSAKTVRTSVERLDKLMTLVGELVTDRNRLLQAQVLLSTRYKDGEFAGELAQAISHLASITDELQEEVMRARMLPLEHAFSKFPRMVRDLARDAGKAIVLEIEGQETELDRSVIEEIGDPLMHLLRNAVDHGIEAPEQRRAAGKPDGGTIRLSGRSEGNHIVITISDDGRGIDLDRVRRKAIDRGLITAEAAAHLSDAEVQELIFSPGLSTAEKVTDISGRGVGMDVVRNNVERLHGSVSVKSVKGQGTAFELSLPLTLAIMPVLLVNLHGYTYCIPLNAVTEVLAIDPGTIHTIDRNEVILWRERLLPLLRLRPFFGLNGANGKGQGHQPLPTVAVHWGDEHLGLVVDRLIGQQEIVIKSLGVMIGQVPGLSGSAILGDGSVALIIDVPGLIKRASRLNAELNARVLQ